MRTPKQIASAQRQARLRERRDANEQCRQCDAPAAIIEGELRSLCQLHLDLDAERAQAKRDGRSTLRRTRMVIDEHW